MEGFETRMMKCSNVLSFDAWSGRLGDQVLESYDDRRLQMVERGVSRILNTSVRCYYLFIASINGRTLSRPSFTQAGKCRWDLAAIRS